jgi:uncharacterized membrane protein (DUF373 family)
MLSNIQQEMRVSERRLYIIAAAALAVALAVLVLHHHGTRSTPLDLIGIAGLIVAAGALLSWARNLEKHKNNV